MEQAEIFMVKHMKREVKGQKLCFRIIRLRIREISATKEIQDEKRRALTQKFRNMNQSLNLGKHLPIHASRRSIYLCNEDQILYNLCLDISEYHDLYEVSEEGRYNSNDLNRFYRYLKMSQICPFIKLLAKIDALL
jgi:hypothetical protein